jgi:glycosyltransferase involved in cell wall biosynthesis
MIGDGPESAELQKWVRQNGFREHFKFTGAVEYSEVSAHLAAADIGAAPFNPALHGQLKLGFYWSPLKVFEYMAASLPVVTIDVEPLNDIIRNGRDGMLYPPGDAAACAEKIVKLLKMPEAERQKAGKSAFERVSERYSWDKHCKDLDRIIRKRLNNK